MGVMKQIATYLYLRKKDPESPNTPWIRYMHGINRLSLLLFLFAIVVMIIKMLLKK
jgi:cob(I)alamin adenosyltransferase